MQNLKYLYCYYISYYYSSANYIAQIIKHYLFIFFFFKIYIRIWKITFFYHLFLFLLLFHVDTIQLFTKILISEAARLIVVWTELVVTVLQFLMNVARRRIDLPCYIHGVRERWGVKRSQYLTDDSRQAEWRQVQMLEETRKEYDATWEGHLIFLRKVATLKTILK